MAQYIDKSALVAEIEKRINFNEKLNAHSRLDECNAILSFIDTLEVIEIGVDVGSPEGDLGRKTVQVIDADGNISEVTFNKAQEGE